MDLFLFLLHFPQKFFCTQNSEDPDQTQHFAARAQGLYCLHNTIIRVSGLKMVKKG